MVKLYKIIIIKKAWKFREMEISGDTRREEDEDDDRFVNM